MIDGGRKITENRLGTFRSMEKVEVDMVIVGYKVASKSVQRRDGRPGYQKQKHGRWEMDFFQRFVVGNSDGLVSALNTSQA